MNGRVIPRRTCSPLSEAEMNSVSEKVKQAAFDEAIKKKYGDLVTLQPKPVKPEEFEVKDLFNELLEGIDEPVRKMEEDPLDADGTTVYEKPLNDLLIHAEVLLPQGGVMQQAKVKGRSKDIHGNVIGTYDSNPLLNSIVYDVEFLDSAIKQYSANIITQNMFSQVDELYSIALWIIRVTEEQSGKKIRMYLLNPARNGIVKQQ